MQLLTFSLSVSLATLALYICIHWPGMVLNFTKPLLQLYVPPLLKKPVYDCLICMSSVYTTLAWLLTYGTLHWQLLWAILIVAGINTLLCLTLENLTDYGC